MGQSIAIILGRKGSKGIKHKNKMKILGKKSYLYPFNAAIKSKYINDIFISSDDNEIRNSGKKLGLFLIDRPKRINTDKALFEEALEFSFHAALKKINYKPKYIVILMCNAVTINSNIIDLSIDKLNKNYKADSAVTVSKFNMYSPLRARKINKSGFLDPFVKLSSFGDITKLNCDRGSQGDCYFADMSHSVVRTKCIEKMSQGLLPQKWMGKKILPIFNPDPGCDMDEEWQIEMSKLWIRKNY